MSSEDLWASLEDDKPEQSVPVYTGHELAELNPSDMLVYDMNNEQVIYGDTDALVTSLGACEAIVIACYKVADYVPDLRNDEHSKFWKKDVIPNLIQSLTQDVKARAVIVRSFGSVRDLSITIQKAAEIVKQSRGSPTAIKIAQKNIPAALNELEKSIEEALKLENTAINKFSEQTEQLFQIIGPEAVKYVEQKAEIEEKLNKLHKKQEQLYEELGEKKGEATRYSHMIDATQKHLLGVENQLEETKKRTDELKQMNDSLERTIQNIPAKITKEVKTRSKSGWWIFGSESEKTEVIQVDNPNRIGDQNYYESIIRARIARTKDNQSEEDSKQKVMDDLNECLSDQKGKYEKAKKELEKITKEFNERMVSIQAQIDNCFKQIEDIEQNEKNTTSMTGLMGNPLINCLIEVRTFAKTLKGGASAYSPLVSILKGVKAMVQNEVELLLSPTPADIFLAGNRLFKQVKFLSSYSVGARKALRTSENYNSLANSIENRTSQLQINN